MTSPCCGFSLAVSGMMIPPALVLDNGSKIVEWMKGCGLGPFLAQLDQDERRRFLEEYKARISADDPLRITP
jgi:trans-aconitate methyltransferase